ncbi:NADH-quinone oxidoreductase subunit C [Kitasatospora sp. NPDC051853]|uniref:NADH-quinone oxidoreductase subunit C n=1 Tax=Kitasatospora sp. NPDC051853 TaxID=3364058 RepID=UPI00379B898F
MTHPQITAPLTAENAAEVFGEWATAAEAYQLLTVDVPAERWIEALTTARDVLGLAFFDWLSAVDELADGFSVAAHLADAGSGPVRHLLLRTRVPRAAATLPTAVGVYAGAGWHERETAEMFGIDFTGHPHLITLLLPDGFEGHPLRKEFVLAARVAKAWPGAKEPGESEGDGPARRKMQPAGVPDPNEWGPLKGTLPPVAERPARAARTPRAAAAGAAGAAGSAGAEGAEARPRRTRSISDGSVSQAAEGAPATEAAPRPRRTRSISDGSVSQTAGATPAPEAPSRPAPRSSDAPWHNPAPSTDQPAAAPARPAPPAPPVSGGPGAPAVPATPTPAAEPAPEAKPAAESAPTPEAKPAPSATPAPEAAPAPEAKPAVEPKAKPDAESEPQEGEGA